jgi:glutamine cyclotransferase
MTILRSRRKPAASIYLTSASVGDEFLQYRRKLWICGIVALAAIAIPHAIAALWSVRVVNTYPHDPNAFTQGIVFEDGLFYEGTGLHGQSSIRKADLDTGEILKIRYLPPDFFGEGLTLYKGRIIQLTWRSGIAFVYDKRDFKLLRTFRYAGQGWGITHDGARLIVSDGTATLRMFDPETFEEIGRIQVHDGEGPVDRLNELEYVRGEIFANIWMTDRVARIAPETGRVTGWIDLRGIINPMHKKRSIEAVPNGIAYDARDGRLFVTGKYWSKLFEIQVND